MNAGLLRAAAYPVGLSLPSRPTVTGDAEPDTVRQLEWIGRVWAIGSVAEAIEVASPVLARRVEALCSGQDRRPKHVRRAADALARYLLRFQHRSTPFGLFAGVAALCVTDTFALDWTDVHRPTARVDAEWLEDVIHQLESVFALLRLLPVTADSTWFVRDDRLVVPCQRPCHRRPHQHGSHGDLDAGAHDGSRDSGRGPGEVTVRNSRAVQLIMRRVTATTSTPTTIGALEAMLIAEYPTTPPTTIDALLAELVARRLLLTALRAPMTTTDPLGHVVAVLDSVGADGLDTARPMVAALKNIQAMLTLHDKIPDSQAPESRRRALRISAAAAMTALTGHDVPLAVDLRLGASLTLPTPVAREAERTTDLLAQITPFPSGSGAWRDYHAEFLETYGPGAVVPVGVLTDPGAGLGFPAGYRGSLRARIRSAPAERDMYLAALAQRAALDRTHEIDLTDTMITALAAESDRIPLPHLDLRFHLHARSGHAIEHGDFTLHVTGVAPSAGATTGRFLDLLDPADRDRMTTAYGTVPTLANGATPVQMSSPALQVRTDNVSRAPATHRPVVSIAEHHPAATLAVDDLAVTADTAMFRLIQLSTGRIVEPFVLNAVDLATFTHPLVRFLLELPRARAAAFAPFTWGAAARLPFLPRVRRGRSILAPATWRLQAHDLPGRDADFASWAQRLDLWRHQLTVPATMRLGSDDQQLHLNLDQPVDAMQLRAELDRTGHAVLREAPDITSTGWIDGRPHEITLALASTARPTAHHHPAGRTTTRAVRATVDHDHGHLPGTSHWASVKLYAPSDRLPDILTRHLPHLLDTLTGVSGWWFLRYRDPRDHLRLRLRLRHVDAFGDTAAAVGAWATDLRRHKLFSHLQWDTYRPETGRYGTGDAMDTAETAFAADSAVALAHLRCVADSRGHNGIRSGVHNGPVIHPLALVTANLIDLAISFTGDTAAAMHWLTDHISTRSTMHPTRPVRDQVMRLTDQATGVDAVHAIPGGDSLTSAWMVRRQALQRYHAVLRSGGWHQSEMPLASLMHLAYLRTVGIDRDGEDLCMRLVRSAALAWTSRTEGAT